MQDGNPVSTWLAIVVVSGLLAVALAAGCGPAARGARVANPEQLPSGRVPEQVLPQNETVDREDDLPPVTKEPPRYPKLDSSLNRLAATDRTIGKAGAGGSGRTSDPVLVTFYVEADWVDDVRQFLEERGVFVRNVGDDYIEAHVPRGMLGAASEQEGVLRVETVRPPRRSQTQPKAVSQGVGLHGADAWHGAGYRGSVKVGVIDHGFEDFRRLMGTELPGEVTARCYSETARAPTARIADCEADGDHGTAVAETLIDVAPDGQLYIANPLSSGDLRNAVDWMAAQGVKVINLSLGYLPDGPGDGTSPYGNSPLRTIDAAVSHGITWVTAGGNAATTTWYGTFSDMDGDGNHNFTPTDEGNTFEVPEGGDVTIHMRWDDSWERADCDLDLMLARPVRGGPADVVAVDATVQDGGEGSVPFAVVAMDAATAAQEGTYFWGMRKGACADDPAWIQVFAWIDDDLEYQSPGHHMGNPEESRNPGALTVGATHWWDTQTIARYSSRGPTLDGRTKPDLTGVACGRSTIVAPETVTSSGGAIMCWFAGTSASAPHVAGLAALVKQRFQNYAPEFVARYLKRNAAERGSVGADNTWGYGLATLPDPNAVPPPIRAAPAANITAVNGLNTGEAVIAWDAAPGATHYRIGCVNMERDYPRAKASSTGNWREAFLYFDVDARNVVLDQISIRRS